MSQIFPSFSSRLSAKGDCHCYHSKAKGCVQGVVEAEHVSKSIEVSVAGGEKLRRDKNRH